MNILEHRKEIGIVGEYMDHRSATRQLSKQFHDEPAVALFSHSDQ